MAATAIPIDSIPSINPATGEVLAYFEKTPPSAMPRIVASAREAQTTWAKKPVHERCAQLRQLQKRMMEMRDEFADAVVRESGKPRVEALFADVFVALDTAAYFAKNGAKLLQP